MEPAKTFNNVIIGQFALTGVPVKVYVGGRYLIITDPDDIESPDMGFGMDENGAMRHFNYTEIDHLLVSGNQITLDIYNDGMGATEEEPAKEDDAESDKEDDAESDKLPKEAKMNLQDIIKEISAEEVDAEIEGAEAQIDAAKAKEKAAKAAVKDVIKKSKDKIKAAKAQMKVAEEGVELSLKEIMKKIIGKK